MESSVSSTFTSTSISPLLSTGLTVDDSLPLPSLLPFSLLHTLYFHSLRRPPLPALTWVNSKNEDELSLNYRELWGEIVALARKMRNIIGETGRRESKTYNQNVNGDGHDGDNNANEEKHYTPTTPPTVYVILCYDFSLSFIKSFLSVLLCGYVALPVYAIDPSNLTRSLRVLNEIVRITGNQLAAIFTSTKINNFRKLSQITQGSLWPKGMTWVDTEGMGMSAAERKKLNASDTVPLPLKSLESEFPGLLFGCDPSHLSFVQFTSGSTSLPKGVKISHGNILHNISKITTHFVELMKRKMKISESSDTESLSSESKCENLIYCSWLPHSHDFGLVVCYLSCLFSGAHGYFFSPIDFISDPSLWLRIIHRVKANITASPNFALQLLVDKIPLSLMSKIDLSSLLSLSIAAEPIKKETIMAFLAKFSPCGIKDSMLAPAFGLAENTVGTTKRHVNSLDTPLRFSTKYPHLVSLGSLWEEDEVDIRIVSDKGEEVQSGEEGEIWLKSGSTSSGYLNLSIDSQASESFNGILTKSSFPSHSLSSSLSTVTLPHHDPLTVLPPTRYLRTGDVGFIECGHLYLCGRIKDIVIFRGQKYHLHDIEQVAETAANNREKEKEKEKENSAKYTLKIRPGCCCAFDAGDAIELESKKPFQSSSQSALRLVLLVEMKKGFDTKSPIHQGVSNYDSLSLILSSSVHRQLGIPLWKIVFLRPKCVEKTSSGKIQRKNNREHFIKGKWLKDKTIIYTWETQAKENVGKGNIKANENEEHHDNNNNNDNNNNQQIPMTNGTLSPRVTVCVVGGGPSGMVTAYELYKLGYSVTVLERDDLIGGKGRSFTVGKDILDRGAHFIGLSYRGVGKLIRELHVETERCEPTEIIGNDGNVITDTVEKFYQSKSPSQNGNDNESNWSFVAKEMRDVLSVYPSSHSAGLYQMDEKTTQVKLHNVMSPESLKSLNMGVSFVGSSSGYGFILPVSDDPDAMPLCLPSPYSLKIFSLSDVSHASKMFTPENNHVELTIKYGYGKLWDQMEQVITTDKNNVGEKGKVIKGAKVNQIIRQRDGKGPVIVDVQMTNENENRHVSLSFDHVVVAVPGPSILSVLGSGASTLDDTLFSKVKCFRYCSITFTMEMRPNGNRDKEKNKSNISSGHPAFYLPHQWNLSSSASLCSGHPVAFHKRYSYSNVWMAYSYVGTLSETQLVQTLKDDVDKWDNGMSVTTIHCVDIFDDYMPHVDSVTMGSGFFSQLDSLQGNGNVYFVGSLFNYENIEANVRFSTHLVERFFGANKNSFEKQTMRNQIKQAEVNDIIQKGSGSDHQGFGPLFHDDQKDEDKDTLFSESALDAFLQTEFVSVLNLSDHSVNSDSNFFDIGGTSMTAVELVGRIRAFRNPNHETLTLTRTKTTESDMSETEMEMESTDNNPSNGIFSSVVSAAMIFEFPTPKSLAQELVRTLESMGNAVSVKVTMESNSEALPLAESDVLSPHYGDEEKNVSELDSNSGVTNVLSPFFLLFVQLLSVIFILCNVCFGLGLGYYVVVILLVPIQIEWNVNLWGILSINFALFGVIVAITSLLLHTLWRRLLIGFHRPRVIPSSSFFSQWAFFTFRNWFKSLDILLRVLHGTEYYNYYLRSMGANIGRNVKIFTSHIDTPDILTVRDNVIISHGVRLEGYNIIMNTKHRSCFAVCGGDIDLQSLIIGSHCILLEQCVIQRGSTIGNHVRVEPLSFLRGNISSGTRWEGTKAAKRDPNQWNPIISNPNANDKMSFATIVMILQHLFVAVVYFAFLLLSVQPIVLTSYLTLSVGDISQSDFHQYLFFIGIPLPYYCLLPIWIVIWSTCNLLAFTLVHRIISWISDLVSYFLSQNDNCDYSIYSWKFIFASLIPDLIQYFNPLANFLLSPTNLSSQWIKLLGANVESNVVVLGPLYGNIHCPIRKIHLQRGTFIASLVSIGSMDITDKFEVRNDFSSLSLPQNTFVGNRAVIMAGTDFHSHHGVVVGSMTTTNVHTKWPINTEHATQSSSSNTRHNDMGKSNVHGNSVDIEKGSSGHSAIEMSSPVDNLTNNNKKHKQSKSDTVRNPIASGITLVGSPPFILRANANANANVTESPSPSSSFSIGPWTMALLGTLYLAFFCGIQGLIIYPLSLIMDTEGIAAYRYANYLILPLMVILFIVVSNVFTVILKHIVMGTIREGSFPYEGIWYQHRQLVYGTFYLNIFNIIFSQLFSGSLWVNYFYILLGVQMSDPQSVIVDGIFSITEFDLVTIGENTVVEDESIVQPHTFEDRLMKLKSVTVGNGSRVGGGSLSLAGVTMGDGVTALPNTLMLKNEQFPTRTKWAGSPAKFQISQ